MSHSGLGAVSTAGTKWAQTWFSKCDEGLTSDVVTNTISPAIVDLSGSLLCVSLRKNSIGDLGATSLSVAVSQCLLLQRIDLSDNLIGPNGAIKLSNIFRTCRRVSEVVLSQNPFGDEGGLALAAAFKECSTPSLEILLISGCELSSSTIREITAAIRVHSCMVSLDISRNRIDASGAECIFEALKTHEHICNIDFSHNQIGDSGIIAAAHCLAQFNSSVRRTGLENNGISTAGAVQFLSLLHSRGLDHVSLGQLDPCGPLQSVLKSEEWCITGLPTPPDDVRDWVVALAFIRESLVSGRQTLRRMRFMLIGDGLAGKTRLAGALLNTQGNNHPDVAITNRTIGIDCSPLQLHSAHGGAIDVQVWDFAGQEVSYLSHTQYFSARRCLYLLVWSPFLPPPLGGRAAATAASFASADQITRPLLLWMEMLFLHVPDAQFVLCGTHAAAARALSEGDYSSLCSAVEARVAHKLEHLAALAQAELRDLKARQKDLEQQLQDTASRMPGNAVIASADDMSQWSRLSEDKRLPRTRRLTAAAAAKAASLLRSVRDRIALIQDASSTPPCHKKLQLLDCARVDSSDGSGIAELRDVLVWHCESMPVLAEEIPKAWVLAESLFATMHKQNKKGTDEKLGHVIAREDAVNFISSVMSDLQQVWETIEFWGYLGRVFIYETAHGLTRQWWIVPDMMFLLDLIRPLIHWDPPRMLATDPELCVLSARELHSDDRRAAEALLADLKRDAVLRRRLLRYLEKWSTLQPDQQAAMLDFFHQCHLVCTVDESPTPFCLPFDSQADSYLVTARVHGITAQNIFPPSPSDMSTYHAQFCLPLLHISFLMRLQSRLLARKTSIDLRVQLHQDRVFVRRNTGHANKFYCCIQSLPSSDFESIQRLFSPEPVLHEEFQHSIYVHSDDLGLFQFATQAIEETLATLFSGLRYKSCILTDRDRVSGCGLWVELGVHPVPTFSELWQRNWFEEFAPGKSVHSFFPHKRCPIFISHSWSDGTEEFVRLLRLQLQQESLATVCLDSAFFPQKGACAVQNAFRRGLCEAGVVIVCLTPRYLTRPNCLKELQWALDLSDKKMLSVIFLPLHPACTYDGVASLLKHKVVYVSEKNDADCCLFPLREVALDLLQRYQLEHIGDQKAFKFHWPEMKAWLSDSSDGEWKEEEFRNAVKHLVSQPGLRDFLAVECRADENEALCRDINDQLKIDVRAIFKKDVTAAHITSFSPAVYPEKSAAHFFLAFDDHISVRDAKAWLFGWQNLHCSVWPRASDVPAVDGVTYQVLCSCDGKNFNGVDSELKLLSADAFPSEDPNSATKILVSAILLPVGTQISIIEVSDASKRERWLRVLKKLPLHEFRVAAVPVTPIIQSWLQNLPQTPMLTCDLNISACSNAAARSAGRSMPLVLSSIMDALHRADSPGISWQFGNFVAAGECAQPRVTLFLLTAAAVSAISNPTNRCKCQQCEAFFASVDLGAVRQGVVRVSACKVRAVCLEQLSSQQLQSLKDVDKDALLNVSFRGDIVSDCIHHEAYLESAQLDAKVLLLLKTPMSDAFNLNYREDPQGVVRRRSGGQTANM